MKIDEVFPQINFALKKESSIGQYKLLEQQLDKPPKSQKEDEYLQREDVQHIVNGINEFLQPKLTNLSFKLHDKLDSYYVEVVDKKTQEIVREIPAKEILDMRAKMLEYLGLFIDEKQ